MNKPSAERIQRTLDWLRENDLLNPRKPSSSTPTPSPENDADEQPENVITIEQGRTRVEMARVRRAYRPAPRRPHGGGMCLAIRVAG
ncbi:MAG: hypothetical protein WC655_15940 [Candidatus Hydrogenedentales bacterium]|jgi:hypothetical protein